MIASDLVAALYQRSQHAGEEVGADDGANEELQLAMRDLFAIAKAHREMPLTEAEVLLDEPAHQVRLAAVGRLRPDRPFDWWPSIHDQRVTTRPREGRSRLIRSD